MKWVLVVYFMTASGWQPAEMLGKDKIGWSSKIYDTYTECRSRARMFNDDREYAKKIKAVCKKTKK